MRRGVVYPVRVGVRYPGTQDSSKGGAVETGCSDLYDAIYYLIM